MADRKISQSDVEWAWFLTHSLSFVITSWVIHVWLMREGAEESLKCSQVDWYVGKLGRKLLQLLGHWWHCRRRANWNKWNGSNECAAVSVFKWEQRWLEKLTMKVQGQNHDIIATCVALPPRHKREPLMKRYFFLGVQDLSRASSLFSPHERSWSSE